ncbi:hypothetical protein [Methylobacterium sp. J-076]|uniref:hypothetical protein n=1 Tax=Methylobacterium sp. J-076 TaxID=2836655 RepID=UPI001FBBF930|nr:hypothetical protein [Methylobacterium sp. J-076]MCJ2011447.1 hypothetical protein [Methylobacterium sp. J-076]
MEREPWPAASDEPEDETTLPPDTARVDAVLARAVESGLTAGRSDAIAGRVPARLVARAKARTGLTDDAALLAFALANIAVEDRFAPTFRALRGSVDPSLDLEF